MSDIEEGYKEAVLEILGGLISSILIGAFANAGLIPPAYLLMLDLLNGIITLLFLLTLPRLGIGYLIGWVFGLWVMLQTGLVGPLEVAIYFVFPFVVLILKAFQKIRENV